MSSTGEHHDGNDDSHSDNESNGDSGCDEDNQHDDEDVVVDDVKLRERREWRRIDTDQTTDDEAEFQVIRFNTDSIIHWLRALLVILLLFVWFVGFCCVLDYYYFIAS